MSICSRAWAMIIFSWAWPMIICSWAWPMSTCSWSFAQDARALFIKDQFNRDLQLEMGEPAARGDFYHLYINGHYWGLFNSCERIKAGYGATYFGGKPEEYDVVKVDSGGTYKIMATDGGLDAWNTLYEKAKKGLEKDADYFALQGCDSEGVRVPEMEVLLDVDNLITYMLVIYWGGNLDAPVTQFGRNYGINNWYGIRKKDGSQGFQFFVWDAEHTLGELGVNRTGPFPAGVDSVERSSPQYLWQQCMANREVRGRGGDLVEHHFGKGGVLAPDRLRELFLRRVNEIESAVVCESARWGDVDSNGKRGDAWKEVDRPFTIHHWKQQVRHVLDNYLPYRTEVVRGQLFEHGVIPDLPKPEFNDGHLNDGLALTNQALMPEGTKVYYTLDGQDPRSVGGRVVESAKSVEEPSIPIKGGGELRARAFFNGDWSALASQSPR